MIQRRWRTVSKQNIRSSKVDIFRAGGQQIVNRAIAEHVAGNPTYDVLNAFALEVLQKHGLLQSYAGPETAYYAAGYKDLQNHGVSLYSGYNVIGFNSKLVSKADASKNWDDLLNPHWKGKMAMDNEEYFGTRNASSLGAGKR